MRQIYLILVFLLFAATMYASKLTLCNQEDVSAMYSTFSEAHAAANSGDTIYVYYSQNEYDTFKISKPLIVIGPGVKEGNKIKVPGITIYETAPNTEIIGMDIDKVNCYAANVIVRNNSIYQISVYKNADNCIIKQNKFTEINNSDIINVYSNTSAVYIYNNYITSIKIISSSIATIKNNYFRGYRLYSNHSVFGTWYLNIEASNSIIENNNYEGVISSYFDFIDGDNNQSSNNNESTSTSILSNAPYPYTAQPAIPLVTEIDIPDVANGTEEISVTVKVEINN